MVNGTNPSSVASVKMKKNAYVNFNQRNAYDDYQPNDDIFDCVHSLQKKNTKLLDN